MYGADWLCREVMSRAHSDSKQAHAEILVLTGRVIVCDLGAAQEHDV